MDRKTLLKYLGSNRKIRFSLWEDYREAKHDWERDLRNQYEMEIRALDYVMEAIRRNEDV